MANTRTHGLRIPDEEWNPAVERAAERGETITGVIRRRLREYVTEDQSEEIANDKIDDTLQIVIANLFDRIRDLEKKTRNLSLIDAEVERRKAPK
jgi:hypothetical protein